MYMLKINMGKYNKENLEKMLLIDNLSYKKIGEFYGVSGVFIRKICIQMNIQIPERAKRLNTHNKGRRKNIFFCMYCKKEIYKMSKIPKFCDNKCQVEYQRNNRIEYWIKNDDKFGNILMNHSQSYIKKYLLEEQVHKCKICGISDIWNNMKMPLILDHIDGNAANNRNVNLRLICSNCDTQLPTYKSKNKKSARTNRYK